MGQVSRYTHIHGHVYVRCSIFCEDIHMYIYINTYTHRGTSISTNLYKLLNYTILYIRDPLNSMMDPHRVPFLESCILYITLLAGPSLFEEF